MKQKLSAATAVIGPVLLIMILSAVTWQIDEQRTLSFDAIPYAIWMLGMGLLVGLYLVLTLAVLPKYPSPALTTCAVMGAIFAIALAAIDWFGFYIPQPFRLETITTLNLTGLLVAGNLACAVLAKKRMGDPA